MPIFTTYKTSDEQDRFSVEIVNIPDLMSWVKNLTRDDDGTVGVIIYPNYEIEIYDKERE